MLCSRDSLVEEGVAVGFGGDASDAEVVSGVEVYQELRGLDRVQLVIFSL